MNYYRVEFLGTVSEVRKEQGTLVAVHSHPPKINVKRSCCKYSVVVKLNAVNCRL